MATARWWIVGLQLMAAVAISGCPDRYLHGGRGEDGAHPPGTHDPARTFYLSASGDDAHSGETRDAAWRTLARANRHVFEPGDALLLEGGASFEGTLQLDANDGGDPEAPIRIGSYGKGRARIEAGEGDGVSIVDVSGAVVEKLVLAGGWDADSQAGNDGEGVSVVASVIGAPREHLRLRELDVSGFKHSGIGIFAQPEDETSKDSGYRDVEISDCVVHDNADFGVQTGGPYIYDGPGYSHFDVRVVRVRAYHNRGLKNKGEHTGSGIVLSDVDGARIAYSVAHDNGEYNDATGGGFGIWAWDSNRVVIEYNEAYDNHSMTADGGGFDLDGGVTNSVMQYNYSHGNHGAGFGAFQFEWARPYSGNLIQYNISQNDGYAFLVWDGNGDMGSLDVVHNVGHGSHPAIATFSVLADTSFVNNVFVGTRPALFEVFDGANLVLAGNAYWAGAGALRIAWNAGTAEPVMFEDFDRFAAATGASGLYGDPGLVAPGEGPTLDDPTRLSSLTMYGLRGDSALIDRGVDLERFDIDAADRDFFGEPAPFGAAPDIGVQELGRR